MTAITGQPGTIYMLHFTTPYRHAQHYVGWTDNLPARLAAHATGHSPPGTAELLFSGLVEAITAQDAA